MFEMGTLENLKYQGTPPVIAIITFLLMSIYFPRILPFLYIWLITKVFSNSYHFDPSPGMNIAFAILLP